MLTGGLETDDENMRQILGESSAKSRLFIIHVSDEFAVEFPASASASARRVFWVLSGQTDCWVKHKFVERCRIRWFLNAVEMALPLR